MSTTPAPSGYRCANCQGWFEYADDWTDDDAIAEAVLNGFDTAEEMPVICDDCYHAMGLLQALLPAAVDFSGAAPEPEESP